MKRNGKLLLNLLALGFLLSCTQTPEQIVRKRKNSIVFLLAPADDNRFIGSGFFVEPDKIATNVHVASGATEIRAKLAGTKKSYSIEGVTAFDLQNDLVILKVAGKGTPLSLSKGWIGEEVFVMGYPGGEYKVTKSKIHSIRKSDKQLRLTTKVVGGNSGGPVLNSKGEVIGVAVRIRGDLGEAIPSSVLDTLLKKADFKKVEALTEWQKRAPVKAYRHFGDGNYEEQPLDAIKKYDRAIELYPRFAEAYHSRGNAKNKLGRYLEAIKDYGKVIELNPADAGAYGNRGAAQSGLGESENELGNVEKAQRHYKAAIEDHDKAIELNPDDASAYTNRGGARVRLGESENELENVEKAQRHYKAAIEDFNKAIELNPADANAYGNRGAAWIRLGESENELGNVEKAQGHYKAAIEDFNKAIELNPAVVSAYNNRRVLWNRLSEFEAKLGNAEKAQQYNEAATADFKKAKELVSEIGK